MIGYVFLIQCNNKTFHDTFHAAMTAIFFILSSINYYIQLDTFNVIFSF